MESALARLAKVADGATPEEVRKALQTVVPEFVPPPPGQPAE